MIIDGRVLHDDESAVATWTANDLATHFGLYHTAFLCQLAHDPTSQINQVVVTFIWQASVARTLCVQVYFKLNSQR